MTVNRLYARHRFNLRFGEPVRLARVPRSATRIDVAHFREGSHVAVHGIASVHAVELRKDVRDLHHLTGHYPWVVHTWTTNQQKPANLHVL
jgi:hypothetical protein